MPAINASTLIAPIIAAFEGVLRNQWPQIKDYAEGEGKKLAHSLEQIVKLRITGQINDDECAVLLEMQKNTTRSVLLALQGMALLTVEEAINAALGAVRDAVNGAIGFAFL